MFNTKRIIKEIFYNLEVRGYRIEVPYQVFVQELMRLTGITNEETIAKNMKAFRDMGYFEVIVPLRTLRLCNSADDPYNFIYEEAQ